MSVARQIEAAQMRIPFLSFFPHFLIFEIFTRRRRGGGGGSLHVINLAGWLAGWRFSVGEVGMLFNNFRLN
jgi:fucose 4-O-acetylase-like acetyltransferase